MQQTPRTNNERNVGHQTDVGHVHFPQKFHWVLIVAIDFLVRAIQLCPIQTVECVDNTLKCRPIVTQVKYPFESWWGVVVSYTKSKHRQKTG